jgi:hypothetical protein
MKYDIRPKVDTCRGDEAVLHIPFARDESDDSV